MHIYLNMNQHNKGLTVGELTMAVGALIIVTLIWSSMNKKDQSKTSFDLQNQNIEVALKSNFLIK